MVARYTGAKTGKESTLAPTATTDVNERFQALVERYGQLLRFAIRKTTSPDSRLQLDDIEQEAQIRIWKALQKGISIANPASYLYRVAVNTTLDAMRRVRARKEEALEVGGGGASGGDDGVVLEIVQTSASPEECAITTDFLDHVQSCMADLGDNRRRAVGLYLQGFTTREIGDLMGWSEAKARNLVYRGIKVLRKQLHARGIEYEGT